ncbi:tropomyosin [Phycomyces blakesleeanus]|uniref:Tropomyosin n=1 Tax=Phycomyces blakesleeanus TaxID=4837 RepID=A0ABR3BGK3_PHYBL
MEKVRERISSLRAEVEAAQTKSEEYEVESKRLAQEQLGLEHEIVSLTNKNRNLEVELNETLEKMKALKGLEEDDDLLKKEKETAQRKINLLEQELENSDKSLRETTKNFREADVKAEHFERKMQQLENIIVNQERKNEELKLKNQELQVLLDEFNAGLDDF